MIFLVLTFSFWLLLNFVFFCTIDLKYIWTFFSTFTAPQYTVDLYKTSKEEFQKVSARKMKRAKSKACEKRKRVKNEACE